MGLGDVDTILDSFLNRNIGTSGLASRKIQQSDIENNNSLRAAVNESQQTMDNQKESITSEFLQRLSKKNAATGGVLRQGTRADSDFDPTKPSAFINIYGGPGNPASSIGGVKNTLGRAIGLTFAGGGNVQEQKDFAGLNDLFDYINDPRFKDTQFRLAGTPSMIDENEMNLLQQRGITPISVDIAKKVAGSWPKLGFSMEGAAKFASSMGGGASRSRTKDADIQVPDLLPADESDIYPKKKNPIKDIREIVTSLGKGYRK